MKLLYLAERRSFEKHGEPMIGDRLVSMPQGPVLSCTYNLMNGELPSTLLIGLRLIKKSIVLTE